MGAAPPGFHDRKVLIQLRSSRADQTLVEPSAASCGRPRIPGWRHSADRAHLLAISLLSGNFTGNFAILRHLEWFGREKPLCCSFLLSNSLLKITEKLFPRSGNFYSTAGISSRTSDLPEQANTSA
jgi:hypothetical protein